MTGPNEDTISELIGPVCEIADLRPTNDWPAELKTLIAAARKVKAFYGFQVVTMSTAD